jgi:hypothetical protein
MLTFDAARHAYTLDGAPVRSVTQLLALVGLVNFDDVPPSILDAARVRGTVVHQAVHYWNDQDLDLVEFRATFPQYVGYLSSWLALCATGRLSTVLCEHRVAHTSPRFAGTFDWLGLFDGEATLLDFATGAPEDAAKHLQLAAYTLAARQWAKRDDEPVLRAFLDQHPFIARFAVRLDRDGRSPQLTPHNDPRDFTRFLTIANAVAVVDDERQHAPMWDWPEVA